MSSLQSQQSHHDRQPLRHRLQRLVHPPVQFDLVVERAENVGDGALFGEGRKNYSCLMQVIPINAGNGGLI